MKNIVRIFALALVAVGAVASTQTTSTSQSKNATVNISMLSAAPTPACPPNDPGGCGISSTRK